MRLQEVQQMNYSQVRNPIDLPPNKNEYALAKDALTLHAHLFDSFQFSHRNRNVNCLAHVFGLSQKHYSPSVKSRIERNEQKNKKFKQFYTLHQQRLPLFECWVFSIYTGRSATDKNK